MKTLVMTLVAALAIGGVALAEDSCPECPTAKKVVDLNTKWEAAAKKMAGLDAAKRQALATKVAEVASGCPVGCKMGPAMAAVRDVLGMAKASCDSDCKDCPCEKLDPESELGKAALQLKAARTATIQHLHVLASHVAGGTCGDCPSSCSECPDAKAEGDSDCEQGSCSDAKDCGEACAEAKSCGGGACPIRIASRIGALRAHYQLAKVEAGKMTVEARTKVLSGFAALAKESEVVQLVPDTVQALGEGLTALDSIHKKMGAFMKANPEFAADIPMGLRMRMMAEIALVDEARLLVGDLGAAMQAMHATATEPASAPAEAR